MTNDPKRHRQPIRLQGWNYTQPGWYFVTICTAGRMCLFGEVVDGNVHLSAMGHIAQEEWSRTPQIRPYVELDVFVIMPNHVHGILIITHDSPYAKSRHAVGATGPVAPTHREKAPFKGLQPGSLGAIIGQFKTEVAIHINRLRTTPGLSVWQRNYHDHIIRNDKDLERIRQYIIHNPILWGEDRYYVSDFKHP